MPTCLQQRESEVKKALGRTGRSIFYPIYSIKRGDGCLTVLIFFLKILFERQSASGERGQREKQALR